MSPARLIRVPCPPILIALLLAFAQSVAAQQVFQLGTPPGSPTMPIPLGLVNLKNGNVHLEIPLKTLVQRNGLKVTLNLVYDSMNCSVQVSQDAWFCGSGWREIYSPFQSGANYSQTSQNTVQCSLGKNTGMYYTPIVWSGFTFTDGTGTTHPFSGISVSNTDVTCTGTPDAPTVGAAWDGTGYTMAVTLSSTNGPPGIQVWDVHGNPVSIGGDTNGNILSPSTDELGRSYIPGNPPTGGSGPQQWAGSTIQWENISAYTAFGGTEFNGTISTISNITLPDQRTYQFMYDQGTTQGHYGQIIGITLPTGGQLSLSYTNVSPGANLGGDRRLTSLSIAGANWGFAYNPNTSYNYWTTPSTTTVTAPPDPSSVQNQSVYSFSYPGGGPGGTTTWSAKLYAGAATGTPLRETDIQLDVDSRVTQQTTILDNGTSSKTIWAYLNTSPSFNLGPMVISKKEYDFSGNLARETTASYQTSTTYTNKYIDDLPLTVKVYGLGGAASGPLMAQTNYSYDGSALSTTSGFLGTSVLGSTGHDDTNYGTGNNIRGNLTSVSQMVSSGTFITTKTNYYNILGELIQTTDARGNTTSFDYTDKWASGTGSCVSGATNAYPTTTKLPTTVTNTSVTIYSGCDGTVYSIQNQNDLNASRAGTVYTYDGLQRVTNVSYPDGGSTQTSYGGTATPQVITTTTAVASGTSIISATTLDGLGRTSQTALTSDPDGITYTAKTYDNLGRAYQVYNPTRCSTPTSNCGETTWGVTTTFYDALSRPCLVVPPDGTLPGSSPCGSQPSNTVLTTYSGNVTTVTDQAGKARKSVTDALGRLTQVFEDPGSSPHLNYETDYGYDALDNLLCVAQKGTNTGTFSSCSSIPTAWRPRLFAYDALSRLTSANNPESGTATYLYDANDNLLQKTSPAPNQTGSTTVTVSYCYDVLDRVTGKAYTAQTCSNGLLPSPLISYFYDQSTSNGLTVANGIGRRTGMTDQAGNEAWSYDSMGRPLTDQRTTNSVSKTTTYTYNLDGSPATLTYPAPATTLTFTQGGAGRPLSANPGFSLAYSAHYAPNGALCSIDSAWGQPFRHDYTFNNRLQPVGIQAWDANSMPAHSPCTIIASGNGDGLDLTYAYADSSGHNNGNVQQIANNLDEHRTQLFTYDSLNRLATANTRSTNQPMWPGDTNALVQCWSEGYSYDAWGSLTAITPSSSSSYTGCTQESGFAMLATTKNQLQDTNNDFVYDSAGNLIQPGPTGVTYTFDAENHLTAAGGMVYLYDGDGKRVGKAPSSTPTQPNFLYWYGGGSNVLQETDGAGNFLYRELYFNGMHFDRQKWDNWEDHFFADALGNVRSVYGEGNPDGGNSDYYPFGAERPQPSGVNVPYKFTGQERDSESGLDNFIARFNSSQFGRFLSADPENAGSDVSDPQSWNAYSYVEGSPINMIDPDGLAPQQQCTIDGGSVACSMALDLIPQGAGSLCPGDNCSHWKFVSGNGFDTFLNTAPLGSADNPRIDPDCSTTNCILVSPYYPLRSRHVDSQGLCSGVLCLSALRKISDFSAGGGDCLTGRCIPFVHNSLTQWGRGSADAVVNKNSWSYAGGELTGGVVGSTILSVSAAAAGGPAGAVFGEGGWLNNNRYLRFGWGWKKGIGPVIRLAAGSRRLPFWWHLDFWP